MRRNISEKSTSKRPVLGREAFAKISAVDGIKLSESARRIFADFDARGLSAEERRHAVIARFKRPAD